MKQSEAYELQYLQALVGVLLGLAKSIYPDAPPYIEESIRLARRILALGASPLSTPKN